MNNSVDTSKEAVERWEMVEVDWPHGRYEAELDENGEWVKYTDYATLLSERDQLRREVEEAREHKHRIQDCVVDLSEAGYLCFVKYKDGIIGEYGEGDRVFLDGETGNIDAHGLYILSNSAWERYKTGERDAALDEAAYFARSAWLFPPDGVDRYDSDAAMCDMISKRILALKARPSTTQQTPPNPHELAP